LVENNELTVYLIDMIESKYDDRILEMAEELGEIDMYPQFTISTYCKDYDFFIYRGLKSGDIMSARVGVELDGNYAMRVGNYYNYYEIKKALRDQNMFIKTLLAKGISNAKNKEIMIHIHKKCLMMNMDVFRIYDVIEGVCKNGDDEMKDYMIGNSGDIGYIEGIMRRMKNQSGLDLQQSRLNL